MRPAGEAGPISRKRNPANGDVEAPSPSCENPTSDHTKANTMSEREQTARITMRVLSIAFPPDKNWVMVQSTEVRRVANLSTPALSGKPKRRDACLAQAID